MNIVLRTLTGLLAAVFGAGLFLVATPTATSADPVTLTKREHAAAELVTVDDDDDGGRDDTSNSGTGQTKTGRDNTNSRVTAVSRDRDLSRRDLTKDRPVTVATAPAITARTRPTTAAATTLGADTGPTGQALLPSQGLPGRGCPTH